VCHPSASLVAYGSLVVVTCSQKEDVYADVVNGVLIIRISIGPPQAGVEEEVEVALR
jgi:hypothetical protein